MSEHTTAVCEGHLEDPPPEAPGAFPAAEDVVAAIRAARGRRGAAASALGVGRTTLWRRTRELGLA